MTPPKGWFDYTQLGKEIPYTRIIAFKTPLKSDIYRNRDNDPKLDRFTPTDCMNAVSRGSNKRLRLVLNLTFTDKYYDPRDFERSGVHYGAIKCPGHEIPNDHLFDKFQSSLYSFFWDYPDPRDLVGVHCTHGVNRTGYMIARFLIECERWDVERAISSVGEARGFPIERENYLGHLRNLHQPSSNFPKIPTARDRERKKDATAPPIPANTPSSSERKVPVKSVVDHTRDPRHPPMDAERVLPPEIEERRSGRAVGCGRAGCGRAGCGRAGCDVGSDVRRSVILKVTVIDSKGKSSENPEGTEEPKKKKRRGGRGRNRRSNRRRLQRDPQFAAKGAKKDGEGTADPEKLPDDDVMNVEGDEMSDHQGNSDDDGFIGLETHDKNSEKFVGFETSENDGFIGFDTNDQDDGDDSLTVVEEDEQTHPVQWNNDFEPCSAENPEVSEGVTDNLAPGNVEEEEHIQSSEPYVRPEK